MPVRASDPPAIGQAATRFLRWLQDEFLYPLRNEIPGFELDEQLSALHLCVSHLEASGSSPEAWGHAGPTAIQTAKYILLKHRMELARDVENHKKQTHHLATRQYLDNQLVPFDLLLRNPQVQAVSSASPPRLSDYLTLQALARTKPLVLEDRVYDEKFGMLTAPSLLMPDLMAHRQACQWRGIPLVLAFIDIDDLKRLNTAHSETVVDAAIMPPVMRAIEGSLYCHGHAYRMGGDEYIALVPSADSELGLLLMSRLQRSLANLQFTGVAARVTASIGVCVVDDACFLTESEIIAIANEAKQRAKEAGKNCIASVQLPQHGKPTPDQFRISQAPARASQT